MYHESCTHVGYCTTDRAAGRFSAHVSAAMPRSCTLTICQEYQVLSEFKILSDLNAK